MYTHDQVVQAFTERRGPVPRSGNPVWRGKNMAYDSADQTLYSYYPNQPIGVWHDGKPYALEQSSYASKTTNRHIGNIPRGIQRVEGVIAKGVYRAGRVHDTRHNYLAFPHPNYFDSCLRPNWPDEKISLTRSYLDWTIAQTDENGVHYTIPVPCYQYGQWGDSPWVIANTAKGWGFKNGRLFLGWFNTLAICRESIALWRKNFNIGPNEMAGWLDENPTHPHWERVVTAVQSWRNCLDASNFLDVLSKL